MKILKKSFSIIMLGLLLLLLSNTNIKASVYESAEEVFPEDQVKDLIKEADNQTIYKDKLLQSTDSSNEVSSSGTYPSRKGVILVTKDKYKGLIPTGHAAIIWTANTVVESLSKGVTTGPNNWNKSKSTCYGVAVSGTSTQQDNEASNWCYAKLGKPYNYNYFNVNTRDKFYCSQLVWAAFKDKYGINLDTDMFGAAVHPIELVNSTHTYTIYTK